MASQKHKEMFFLMFCLSLTENHPVGSRSDMPVWRLQDQRGRGLPLAAQPITCGPGVER